MGYIRVDKHLLKGILDSIIGIEYKKNVRNYGSTLEQEIEQSEHLPLDYKSLDFTRPLRNLRKALDSDKTDTTISSAFLEVIYALFKDEPKPDQPDDEVWEILEKTYRTELGIHDPLINTKWNIFYLAEGDQNDDSNLHKGVLEFQSSMKIVFHQHRKFELPWSRMVGKRAYEPNWGIVHLKLWVLESQMSELEPNFVLKLVLNDAQFDLIEGIYTEIVSDRIFSGSTMLTKIDKDEEHQEKDLNDLASHKSILETSIFDYFKGAFSNQLLTSPKTLSNIDDVYNWIGLREKNNFHKSVDLFISTPILTSKSFDSSQGQVLASITFILSKILKEIIGFENIYSPITDIKYFENQSNRIDLTANQLKNTRHFLYFNPLILKDEEKNNSTLELGWATYDQSISSVLIICKDHSYLPEDLRRKNLLHYSSSKTLIIPKKPSPDNIWNFFQSNEMRNIVYELARHLGRRSINYSGIIESLNQKPDLLEFQNMVFGYV